MRKGYFKLRGTSTSRNSDSLPSRNSDSLPRSAPAARHPDRDQAPIRRSDRPAAARAKSKTDDQPGARNAGDYRIEAAVTTGDINAIRGIESAGTVQRLRNRKLIARTARLGPRREGIWRTTQLFLDTFGLASLDKLYKEGRMEEVFASIYSAEMGTENRAAPSDNAVTEDIEAS